jgi:hypothetical protein
MIGVPTLANLATRVHSFTQVMSNASLVPQVALLVHIVRLNL